MACGANGACGCSGSSLTGYGGCNDSCPSVQIFDWLPESSKVAGRDHCDLVEVAFRGRRRKVYQNKRKIPVHAGDEIIVSAQRGLDYGQVVLTGELVYIRARQNPNYGQVLRLASSNDRSIYNKNKKAEKEALRTAKYAIRRRQLPIKIIDAEWQFDRKRLSFFYTSKNKVSIRPVITDLCRQFKSRVEFLRLTPREETARLGGLGVCGRELCCSSWMRQIPPVSASAAKKMDFSLANERLTGRCGQLKCCLNYELEQYMKILEDFPSKNTKIDTDQGDGHVIGTNIFSRTVRVKLDNGLIEDIELESVKFTKKKPIRSRGKKSTSKKRQAR
ncbi:MAG: regulatory iron-sulfur-containing complex subunit RicT [Bacteroidetes bacterium]|nr:regulatory iron-sulfur-containing complex subunit RicT [Bacteroidota bacterium]MCY4205310.1 regulatory iron-sulfur-containing complex subunit RicT [Bacteroidota bacterium]